jgi:hypothetical protein
MIHHPSSRNALPEDFRPFFWSYRFEDIDLQKDKKTVILNLLNYGNLAHWQWLVRQYGVVEIKRILQSIPATEVKPRTRPLVSLLFSIPLQEHAQRGAY